MCAAAEASASTCGQMHHDVGAGNDLKSPGADAYASLTND
jgi:hypothetical protein